MKIKSICESEAHILSIGDWPSGFDDQDGMRWSWDVAEIIEPKTITRGTDGSITGCFSTMVFGTGDLINEPFMGKTMDREHALAAARDAHAKVCSSKLTPPVVWSNYLER